VVIFLPLPGQFVMELKFQNEIFDVVSSYVNLKRRGKNAIGLCPFHGEKTPSFYVYPESGSFYCFGCGAGGDVITFIEKIENFSYIESVHFLSNRAGMSIPDIDQDNGLMKVRERIFAANREAAKFFYKSLYQNEKALDYLKLRGISDNIIRRFGLGFAPISGFALADYLLKKGFSRDELIKANLVFANKSGVSDRFYNRIMFPIIDLRGNVIAFGGRTISDKVPKYLNTADTAVFKKSANLFALNLAKSAIKDSIILAEGYMDVIALHQFGFKTATATLGTALTIKQAKVISGCAKEVIICYDSDEAGQKATERAIPILKDEGLLVRVLTIPRGKDPDEFIRSFGQEGVFRFKQLINNSNNDVEYRLQKIRKLFDRDTVDGKIAYLKEAVKILCTLENNIEQEIYASRLSEEINIEKSSIMQQVKKGRNKLKKVSFNKKITDIQRNISATRDKINPEKSKFLRAASAEEALLSYMIHNPCEVENISKKLPPEEFCTDFNKRVYVNILQKIKKDPQINIGDFSEKFSSDEIGRITKFFISYISKNDMEKSVDEYINIITLEKNRVKIQESSSINSIEIENYFKILKSEKCGRN
jgi:DNA primase